MISAFSAPSQAYLSLAGSLKVLKISRNGDNKNVLLQSAGPTIKIFLICPILWLGILSLPQQSQLAPHCFLERLQGHSGTSYQSIIQHTFSRVSRMISIRCFCCLWILVATSSIFQVVVTRSCRALGDLLGIIFF